jgi:hypothetical protein
MVSAVLTPSNQRIPLYLLVHINARMRIARPKSGMALTPMLNVSVRESRRYPGILHHPAEAKIG